MIDLIILAGGKGSRLKALFPHLPKILAPIQGIPFIEFLLRSFSRKIPLSRTILALGYEAQQVISHFQKPLSFPAPFFSIEEVPLGTGGALKKAISLSHSPTLLVCNGDGLIDFSFSHLYSLHQQHTADLTMVCVQVEEPDQYGLVEVDPVSQRIHSFCEKKKPLGRKVPQWVNAGVYLMKRDLLNLMPLEEVFSLEKEFFPHLINQRMYAYLSQEKLIDIGTQKSYLEAEKLLKEKLG
jgi:D-glycero-alpha-D-manno-heptose 1-phosphate guanylyltransferase